MSTDVSDDAFSHFLLSKYHPFFKRSLTRNIFQILTCFQIHWKPHQNMMPSFKTSSLWFRFLTICHHSEQEYIYSLCGCACLKCYKFESDVIWWCWWFCRNRGGGEGTFLDLFNINIMTSVVESLSRPITFLLTGTSAGDVNCKLWLFLSLSLCLTVSLSFVMAMIIIKPSTILLLLFQIWKLGPGRDSVRIFGTRFVASCSVSRAMNGKPPPQLLFICVLFTTVSVTL